MAATTEAKREFGGVCACYSPRMLAAFALAREEALRYNHGYIGTEHLLLALLRVSDGVAARLLSLFGINLDRTRHAFEHMCGRGDRAVAVDDPGYLPRARKALELAVEESTATWQAAVGTEHVLLGLLRVEDSVAARILDAFDVTLPQVRRALHKLWTGTLEEAPVPRNQVITCRISDRDLAAIDALVETGIRTGRSEAAAWLISAAIDRNQELFARVFTTLTEIRRLRGETQVAAQQLTSDQA